MTFKSVMKREIVWQISDEIFHPIFDPAPFAIAGLEYLGNIANIWGSDPGSGSSFSSIQPRPGSQAA